MNSGATPHPVVVTDGDGEIKLGHPCSCCGNRKSEIGSEKIGNQEPENRFSDLSASDFQFSDF
jgi:hypothetical protein